MQHIERELAVARQTLQLIRAIDRIRDTIPEPLAMLTAIVNLLAGEFHTAVCFLALRQQDTSEVELKAVHHRTQLALDLEPLMTRDLAERIMHLETTTLWTGEQIHSQPEVHLAAVPIAMAEQEPFGGLLLARSQPFTAEDVQVLTVAEEEIDSAVMQAYTYHDLQQRLKEIATIYRIDRIRDQGLSFDDMLNTVLHELESILEAEISFIMLYNAVGKKLEMRAATSGDLFEMSPYVQRVYDLADACLAEGQLVCHNDLGPALRSLMCLPLILNERIIGVLGVVNRRGQESFRTPDQRLLQAIGSQMDTAIFENLEQRRLRQVLGRSVDPRVMERLLANPNADFLAGERRVLTVLYADIRGSTSLAEHTSPEKLVAFINTYLGTMTEVILAHEGTLDKFVGDEVMALFGAPFPQVDHALRAVRVGLAMQVAHAKILADWIAQGGQAAPIGVGIATGELIVGEMGSAQRTDYTVIGQAANLGARICGVAQAGQVLISPATYALVQDQVEAVPIHGMEFKGVAEQVTVYRVNRMLTP